MAKIKILRIEVEPAELFVEADITEMVFDVRVEYDSGIIKAHRFQQGFTSDHFIPLWERIMERAKREICAAVRETQVNIDG